MPTAAQAMKLATLARPKTTVIVPQVPLPAYISPSTTIAQPNMGPNVGPVPLFATPEPRRKPFHKNPLFFIAVAVVAWYLFA